MRIMGLDYGSKTVGVAVSDALGLTAQGIEIVRRKSENKLRQTLARIEEIAKEYGVEKNRTRLPETYEQRHRRAGRKISRVQRNAGETDRPARCYVGRAADNGRSRPHHDGNRNPQGKPQGVRRYDCSCFYPAGISGLSFPSEGITGKLNKGILYGKNNICNR